MAASGVILQRLLRNPLASPEIIGISSGASPGARDTTTLRRPGSEEPLTDAEEWAYLDAFFDSEMSRQTEIEGAAAA